MKKIFTLLVSSLFSLSLLAYDGSRLSISTFSNSKTELKLEIDGKKFVMQDNSITLGHISEGYHRVKIFREKKRNGNGFGFGQKQEVIYSSSVFLKRGFHLDITVNRFGKALLDERKINSYDNDWDDEDEYFDEDETGGYHENYSNVMDAQDFESVRQTISKEWMESGKLISVKTIMDKNNFTTQQVKELMMLFSFESNKLEVAKYGYRKTVDKHNYIQVNEVFSFSSSREELARFIRESR